MKSVKDLEVGDVFRVNGDTFEVIALEQVEGQDAWKMRYQSQSTNREYIRKIYFADSLFVV